MSLDRGMIEIIPLGNRPVEAGCVTEKMIEIISENVAKWQKTLVFYNRRGSASAWICRDCGFFEKCENCDIALSYHTFPRKHLLCHQCNAKKNPTFECPRCHNYNFVTLGFGIEQIAENIALRSGVRVEIFDSDHAKKPREIFEKIESAEVIVSTNLGSLFSDERIASVIFALFEVNISVPEYDLEEELYAQISYFKKQQKSLYIQTFAPEHLLLQEIVFGNYKTFLDALKKERKAFSYPPFSDFAIIRVRHRDKMQVKNMLAWLVEHIEKIPKNKTFFAYDTDIFEKSHGEFMQKIILKWTEVSDILEKISPLVIRNKNIFVDWQ